MKVSKSRSFPQGSNPMAECERLSAVIPILRAQCQHFNFNLKKLIIIPLPG